MLPAKDKAYRPSLKDLSARADVPDKYGWLLEDFITKEFLECREGAQFNTVQDDAIQTLFYRRTGAIAAAIAITIEAPPTVA